LRGYKELGIHLRMMDDGELISPSALCNKLFIRPDQFERAHEWKARGWEIRGCEEAPGLVQGVIVPYGNTWDAFAHFPEFLAAGQVILPGWSDQIMDAGVIEHMRNRAHAPMDAYPQHAKYLFETGMKGHYLEFGTFYGGGFVKNFAHLGGILKGSFYGFDSFQGLPEVPQEETAFSGGKFVLGNYSCNEASFKLIIEFCGVDMNRVKTVSGFYETSLRGKTGFDYGIGTESVSVCVIDCDIKEATQDVLTFVTPLLQPGALIYFDDWLLTRGSPAVGERAAALEWLEKNPNFELIEFLAESSNWQARWFVFQKK
jgi:hypothetical protein